MLEILPELASAVSAPLARTDKIVMIGGGGNGATPGASRITRDVAQVMAELPAVLEALTGMKFEEIAKRVPGLGDASRATGAEAQPGKADADGSAEEVR